MILDSCKNDVTTTLTISPDKIMDKYFKVGLTEWPMRFFIPCALTSLKVRKITRPNLHMTQIKANLALLWTA